MSSRIEAAAQALQAAIAAETAALADHRAADAAQRAAQMKHNWTSRRTEEARAELLRCAGDEEGAKALDD